MLKWLLILGIVASPFYLLPSGSIQVYHAVLALLALVVLLRPEGVKVSGVVIAAILFWAYVILRQSLYIMGHVEADLATLLYPTLNMAVFVGVYSWLSRGVTLGGQRQIMVAFAAVMALELAYIFLENQSVTFFLHSKLRSIGTFNNPNQLGYFSVLAGCSFLLLGSSGSASKPAILAGLALAYLLAVISLSKAAMLAISPLLLIALWGWGKEIKSNLFKAFIAAAAFTALAGMAAVAVSYWHGGPLLENEVIRRLALIGHDHDDTLLARGYALILHPDARIIFGYGEGYYKWLFGKEVHSTLANVLTSYGIAGFGFFATFLLYTVRFRLFSLHFALVSLVLAYGLTHNGLRNTLFWVFLAIVAWQAEKADTARHKGGVPLMKQVKRDWHALT